MKHVIAYLHTHWDREWYREFEAFRLRLLDVLDEVFEALENNTIPYFYLDGQTAMLEDYLELKPERKEFVKELLQNGKINLGPFYCSTDSFLVSGEMFIRNLYLGIKKSQEFGENHFISYIADSFGHSYAVTRILKSFNMDKAMLWRGLGNINSDILWNGIKTTYLRQGYYQDFFTSNLSIEQKAKGIEKYLDKISEKGNDTLLLAIGGDHLGIPSDLKEQIKEVNKILKGKYEIELSSPFEYFKEQEKTKREVVDKEFLDNEKNFILPGIYSSRLDIKRENALCEWGLSRLVEPMQALSYFFFDTKSRQIECDYAYKTLIKNHAHDSIYGCSIDEVNDKVLSRFSDVKTLSSEIMNMSKYALGQFKGDLCVFNFSNFKYSGEIKVITEKKLPKFLNAKRIRTFKGFPKQLIYNTKCVPITEDYTTMYEYSIDVKGLKPFSLTKLSAENICEQTSLKTTEKSIENEYIKLQIKNQKVFVFDKNLNTEYSDFFKLEDFADIGDSYNFGALANDNGIQAKLSEFKFVRNDSIKATIKLVYTIDIPQKSTKKGRSKTTKKHQISVLASLSNQSKTLELKVIWDNKSTDHILKFGINLKEKITKTLNEDLFGVVERTFNPDFDIYNQVPAPKGIEIKPNTSPLKRFCSIQGVTLLSKGNTEYEVSKNTLYLTLLRATGTISNPTNSTRGTPAGPPLETPKLQQLGENKAEFGISFTDNKLEMFKRAEEFYSPCIDVFSNYENRQFFCIENKNILVYAIKTNDKNLVLRLFNLSDKPSRTSIKLPQKFKLYETNSLEEKINEIHGEIKFEGNEIKTIVISKAKR